MAFCGVWQGTDGKSAEETIADAGHDAVGEITQASRDKGKEACQQRPPSIQVGKYRNRGIRPQQYPLPGGKRIDYQADRVESSGIQATTGENLGSQRILKGAESVLVLKIMAENEPHKAIAETADSIIKNQ